MDYDKEIVPTLSMTKNLFQRGQNNKIVYKWTMTKMLFKNRKMTKKLF